MVLVAALALSISQNPVQQPKYIELQMEGWKLHVEQAIVTTRPKLWEAAKNELMCQFLRIKRVVPDDALGKIQKVSFFVHLNNPKNVAAAYHPSRTWLIENKQNPDMARCIEIGNLENFVAWTYHQPWMIMHELAHAYHDQFLPDGWNNKDILNAFKSAVDSKKYDEILWYDGGKRKAYGLNNQMEYFAETSESYFGQNDGFPFIRAELKEFDSVGYAAMQKVWGDPVIRVPKDGN